ncbi:MAG: SgcJ/EcaC family oxidoreductase [Acidobacteriaceae bacterium]|nr:SgcJ/EcaC family oxidoreductase [Acidobacteriaceae bacterium]
MRLLRSALVVLFFWTGSGIGADGGSAIRAEMAAQEQAWNNGDIPGFMRAYADDCTFVSKQVVHGKDALQRRYEKKYPSRQRMGTLSFSGIEVQALDAQVAIVTGQFHLARAASAGGAAHGTFSLVWQLQNGHWKIMLDHTA